MMHLDMMLPEHSHKLQILLRKKYLNSVRYVEIAKELNDNFNNKELIKECNKNVKIDIELSESILMISSLYDA